MAINKSDQFFRVKADRQEYLGERYFRYNVISEKVIQVCLGVGQIKKGKSNNIGIYMIHKMSFVSNYLSMNYVEIIPKKTYDKMFSKASDMLK